LAGILYDRYKTRLIFYYGGLFNIMPIFSFFFFIFSFLNISFPGTIGFVGELLVLTGFLNINFFYTFLVILCLILSVIYSIWLLNRIIFGNFKKINVIYFYDLNFREFLILVPFLVISIILGIKPSLCLDYLILI
jgi:NADH:ubiquinone oxidoreductase subunit 4 (subunit M)